MLQGSSYCICFYCDFSKTIVYKYIISKGIIENTLFAMITSMIFFDFRYNARSATAKFYIILIVFFNRTNGRLDFAFIIFKLIIVTLFSFMNSSNNDIILIGVYTVGCYLLFEKV